MLGAARRAPTAILPGALVTLLAACAAIASRPPRSPAAERAAAAANGPRPTVMTTPATALADVDHVIVGIDSLERGIELLRAATGVAPVVGGAHPGRGTRNALLSLGAGHYLELMAPNPADEGGARVAREMAAYRALTPIGWAVRTADAAALATTLKRRGLPAGEPRPGERKRPDGATLRWRTLAPWDEDSALLPFFIEWAPESRHPSADAPAGCTLAALTLASPSAATLAPLLERGGVALPVTSGPVERMTLTLDCPAGRVVLPPR